MNIIQKAQGLVFVVRDNDTLLILAVSVISAPKLFIVLSKKV